MTQAGANAPSAALSSSSSRGQPPEEPVVDELSLADSFIMEVLRGWQLLQAAGLTAEEKRDILSTTKNLLDFETIAAALQNLWDEQLFGGRLGSNHTMQGYAAFQDEHEAFYSDYQDDWWARNDDWWDDYAFYTDHYDDDWWSDGHVTATQATAVAESLSPEEEEKVREAHQAERIAEGLAMEANRTWSEAQRATQALRKDRGFGKVGPSSTSSGPLRCYLCGGPHLARECPDRRHPSYNKGYGKGKTSIYAMRRTLTTTTACSLQRGSSRGSRSPRRHDG